MVVLKWDEWPEALTDKTIKMMILWTLRSFLSRHSYYLVSWNLTWQKFCLSMFTDEHKTPATYLEHHKQPVCNLYFNPQNVMRNETEVCVSFFKRHSVINKNISYCSRCWLFFNLQSYILLLERFFQPCNDALFVPFSSPLVTLIMHP